MGEKGNMLRKQFPAMLGMMLISNAPFANAGGDPVRGEALYESRCIACHSIDANRGGPAHKGVYGRKAGSVSDYSYSDALRMSKIVWDEQTLDRWLTNPEQSIPGQRMGYSVPEAADRADLIAYLRLHSGK